MADEELDSEEILKTGWTDAAREASLLTRQRDAAFQSAHGHLTDLLSASKGQSTRRGNMGGGGGGSANINPAAGPPPKPFQASYIPPDKKAAKGSKSKASAAAKAAAAKAKAAAAITAKIQAASAALATAALLHQQATAAMGVANNQHSPTPAPAPTSNSAAPPPPSGSTASPANQLGGTTTTGPQGTVVTAGAGAGTAALNTAQRAAGATLTPTSGVPKVTLGKPGASLAKNPTKMERALRNGTRATRGAHIHVRHDKVKAGKLAKSYLLYPASDKSENDLLEIWTHSQLSAGFDHLVKSLTEIEDAEEFVSMVKQLDEIEAYMPTQPETPLSLLLARMNRLHEDNAQLLPDGTLVSKSFFDLALENGITKLKVAVPEIAVPNEVELTGFPTIDPKDLLDEEMGGEVAIIKSLDQSDLKRYTFGVVYKASNSTAKDYHLDAHSEFMDADELQKMQWGYVQKGNRNIYVQHGLNPSDSFKKAGEWVDLVMWPYPVEVPVTKAIGDVSADTVTIPAKSVFMGVHWEPWAWKRVTAPDDDPTKIRGYSFGGHGKRVPVNEDVDSFEAAITSKRLK